MSTNVDIVHNVSVAGCLGYDVLVLNIVISNHRFMFQLLVV